MVRWVCTRMDLELRENVNDSTAVNFGIGVLRSRREDPQWITFSFFASGIGEVWPMGFPLYLIYQNIPLVLADLHVSFCQFGWSCLSCQTFSFVAQLNLIFQQNQFALPAPTGLIGVHITYLKLLCTDLHAKTNLILKFLIEHSNSLCSLFVNSYQARSIEEAVCWFSYQCLRFGRILKTCPIKVTDLGAF